MDLTFKGKCTHCGKIRTYKENFNIDYYIPCLVCGKQGELKEMV